MGLLPLVLRTRQTLTSWRATVDTDELVKHRVAHVAMLVLLFGAHIERWVCDWSDLHAPKATTDIEARVADFAARTRRICFGAREQILHQTLCMLPADHLLSVANAWLVHQLASAHRRVSSLPRFAELRDIVRHRLLPLIVRHCVLLAPDRGGRKRKSTGAEPDAEDDAVAAAEWVLRATTIEDIYGEKSKAALRNTPLYPFPIALPAETTPPALFEHVTLFLPRFKEKMVAALRAAQEHELARWVSREVALGETATFARVGGGGDEAATTAVRDARFLLSDLRQDCAPVLVVGADSLPPATVAAYIFVDASCSPPAFAARAFVCFCARHALPKLQRITVFRPDISHPPAHRKCSHWSDAAGIDWLPSDTCARRRPPLTTAGRAAARTRPGCFRVFATCRPGWSDAWQRSSDAAFKLVAGGASTRTVADAIVRIAPLFHSAILVADAGDGDAEGAAVSVRVFCLVPRTACVHGNLLRLTKGSISVSPAPAPAFSLAFIDACMSAHQQPPPRLRAVLPNDALPVSTSSIMIEYALVNS